MKKYYILLLSVLIMFSASCFRSQFSTTTRQYKHGRTTFANHHRTERSRLSKIKSPQKHLPPIDPQNPVSGAENLIASTSNEPVILDMNENRVVPGNQTVLSENEPNGIITYASIKDSIRPDTEKGETALNLSKPHVIKYKDGRRKTVRIISLSHDTLVYNNIGEPNVTRTTTMEQGDTILPDTRKTEPIGVIGFVTSVLSLIPIFFLAPYIGMPLAAISVVLGLLSIRRIRHNKERFKGRGFAYASVVLGIIGFFTMAILLFSMATTACSNALRFSM